jgi:cystathionine gamma-synthase
MGGSTAINPLSPHAASLHTLWKANFHNEVFTPDVDVLLSNSEDYLARSQILNRNADAMAVFLHQQAQDPASPVKRVLYPSVLPDRDIYRAYMRRPTPDFPEPGYGCLLSVDFDSVATATAFYDALGFYAGPHLGAHKSLQLAYNVIVFGKKPGELDYHRRYGVLEETVRISAGLENVEDLIDTLKVAVAAAAEKKGN